MSSIPSALVTGGTGFVGSAIIDALMEQHPECAVTSLDVKPANGDAKRRPSVNYITVDLTVLKDTLRVVQEVKPSVIIHTAGIVPLLTSRYTRKDRDLVWKINVGGTKNILAAARMAGAQAFVYTSSCCSVTDDMKYQYPNVDETWPISNHSLIYGESKAEAEALVLGACSEKLSTCAIRPSVVLGPEDYQLIPSIHTCIAKHETPFIIGAGDNLWDVTYVSNVADAHVLAAENLLTTGTAAGEAFFISNNEPIPFRDFCLEIWKYFGHYPPFEVYIPQGLARVAGYAAEWITWLTGTPTTLSSGSVLDACSTRYCSGVKARKILGYEPRVGIEEGIRISCEAYAKRLAQHARENLKEIHGHKEMNGHKSMNGHREMNGHSLLDVRKEMNGHAGSVGGMEMNGHKVTNGSTRRSKRLNGSVDTNGSKKMNGHIAINGYRDKNRNKAVNGNGTMNGNSLLGGNGMIKGNGTMNGNAMNGSGMVVMG